MEYVRVSSGFVHNGTVAVRDTVFPLLQEYRPHVAHGCMGFLKVDVSNHPGLSERRRDIRLYVKSMDAFCKTTHEDFVVSVGYNPVEIEEYTRGSVIPAVFAEETDDEIAARIDGKFETLSELVGGAADGILRGLLVTGNPGLGKSFGVEDTLAKFEMQADLSNGGFGFRTETIKGSISASVLFCALWDHRAANSVLVLDDCDAVLQDDECINLLKAAMDSGRRKVSYRKNSNHIREHGADNTFEFKGAIVILSNIDLQHEIDKGTKKAAHLEAISSRSHWCDVTLRDTREKMVRIKSVMGNIRHHRLSEERYQEVFEFLSENADRMRELSIRTALKLCDLVALNPDTWKKNALSMMVR